MSDEDDKPAEHWRHGDADAFWIQILGYPWVRDTRLLLLLGNLALNEIHFTHKLVQLTVNYIMPIKRIYIKTYSLSVYV